MSDRKEIPQEAPWPVGTRLRELRPEGGKSGYPGRNGKSVWTSYHGAMHTVVKIGRYGYAEWYTDEDTGEQRWICNHDCSILESDDDPGGRHHLAIDVNYLSSFMPV